MVWSVLPSEALLYLGHPAGVGNRLFLGSGPKLLLASVPGLPSPATCCLSAFLVASTSIPFLASTSQVLHLHKVLLALAAPVAPAFRLRRSG